MSTKASELPNNVKENMMIKLESMARKAGYAPDTYTVYHEDMQGGKFSLSMTIELTEAE